MLWWLDIWYNTDRNEAVMKFFPDSTTFLQLGPFMIKWYAVIILSGALLAYYIVRNNFKKKDWPLNMAEDIFLGGLLSGILGARLWYVLFSGHLGEYLAQPLSIFNFMQGGLAIHGGLFGGFVFAFWYIRKNGYHFMNMADEIVYTILVGQAIGRWGNFINKEAHGPAVSEASLSFLPDFIQEGMNINGTYYMPTFLMESVLNIIGFMIIHFVLKRSKSRKRGDLIYAYLMWYGMVRFFIEIFRTDALLVNGGLKIAQVMSIGFMVIGILGFFGVFRKLFPVKPATIIFDFDQTLINTYDTIITTFKEVFSRHELTKDIESIDYNSLVGPTLADSFNQYIVNPDVDSLIEEYRTEMVKNHHALATSMPYANELVKALKDKGHKVAILSNKQTDMIYMGLKQINMDQDIDLVVGLDLVQEKKPSEKGIYQILKQFKGFKDNVVMIGDSVDDVLTGQNANAFTVGYVSLKPRETMIKELNPKRVIYSLEELQEGFSQEELWNNNTIL